MKCYCGGAGPAPEEVLGFDNALTRNARQAVAKWACLCSGVGSQDWSAQPPYPPSPRGTVQAPPLFLKKKTKKLLDGREKKGSERVSVGVCSWKLSWCGFECVCVCL